MVELWGQTFSAGELKQRYGDVSQVGGLRPLVLADGPAKGASVVDVATGTGFRFTVALDRGMDITEASYAGKSLCWRSCTGDKHPGHFQHGGNEWLRHFFGGLVLTCGLTQAGAPCRDEETGEELGIHGRYTAIPAQMVRFEQGWDGDEFAMSVTGTMRDSVVFFENLVLTRTVRSRLGSNSFTIEDRVENAGFLPAPFMILYHCNIGFPALDAGSRLLMAARSIQPRDPEAERGVDTCTQFQAPTQAYREQCFFHDMLADQDGKATAAIVNPDCDGGFGIYLRYDREALPWFSQWKMMGQGNYTCGLEPANCLPLGRAAWRRQGQLRMLEPGEVVTSTLELGCLVGADEIASLERKIRDVAKRAGCKEPEVRPRFCDADIGR